MFGKVVYGASFLALIGAGIGAWTWQPDLGRELEVVGGSSSVSLLPSVLSSNLLKVSFAESASQIHETGEPTLAFRVSSSDLKFVVVDGRFDRIEGGTVSHEGGFTISKGSGVIDASRFSVVTSATDPDILEVRVGTGRQTYTAFELSYPRYIYDAVERKLVIGSMDMVLTRRGAQALGQLQLAGQLFGTLSVIGDAKPSDGLGDVEIPTQQFQPVSSAPIDVRISALSSLTVLGRVGTFPNGRNGLSMSTTSCNVGTSNIPWNAPMQVTHPVIAMNLYRVMNGRFEQVGWSWLKHGFLATNQNQCGSCQHPGTGSLLGPNCSDTYGTGNNGDRFYLGERKEVNPFTGVWDCVGSWFSNYQPDCVRRNTGSGLDVVAHRLEVADADLGNAGATYYYEAYYINANDFDKYNNVSHRGATFSWGGSSWSVSSLGASQTQGVAINNWGEQRTIAEPRAEGDVIVAVQTTNLGGGMWHYEFAVYNHDLDRQVKEFSIPVPVGTIVQNIGFRDIDQDGTNQWSSSVAGGQIKWSTATNPLMYSSVFNFRFDADMPPMASMATMVPSKAGSASQIVSATKGPLVLMPVSSFTLDSATQLGGNLASLAARDGDRLLLTPDIAGTRTGSGITTSMTAPNGTFGSLTVGVLSRNSLGAGGGGLQTTQMWNWNTSSWELLDSRATTQNDTFAIIKVASNPGRFINSSTREVRSRIVHTSALGADGYRWTFGLDQVGFQFE